MLRVLAIATALVLSAGGPATAGPTPFGVVASPVVRDPAPKPEAAPPAFQRVQDFLPPTMTWTEPLGSFSFQKPNGWPNVDTASMPGEAKLDIVAGNEDAECWFSRMLRERTAALSPAELIAARSKPISAELWNRISSPQQLLMGSSELVKSAVEYVNGWPVQTAVLRGKNGLVYAALHSRPGLDVWAFCAAKDSRDRSAQLTTVARSVSTPKDAAWARLVPAQANFTAVP